MSRRLDNYHEYMRNRTRNRAKYGVKVLLGCIIATWCFASVGLLIAFIIGA